MKDFDRIFSRFGGLFLPVALLSVLSALSACTGAKIEGRIEGAARQEVTVAVLDFNRFQAPDTLKTDARGRYACRMDVGKGDPDFVYLYHKGRQIGSLILQKGERCRVVSDTLGNYTVTGSPESERLAEAVRKEAAFRAVMETLSDRLDAVAGTAEEAEVKALISKEYVDYYRSCVRWIMEHPRSLSSVQVLYQSLAGGLPVFSQLTDAIHFRNVADSLRTVYPDSRYVKALEGEADRRFARLEIDGKLKNAAQAGLIDLELPDIQGRPVRLSEVKAKVVMLYFWGTGPEQNLFTSDVIQPVYEAYHDKGFEIYSVCADTDKVRWASVVRNQRQAWINVCDGLGAASPALAAYLVERIPASFLIVDGALVAGTKIKDGAGLRRFLDRNLK